MSATAPTSLKRGQSYVTVIFDADKSGVIDVEEGRKVETVIVFHSNLKQSKGIAIRSGNSAQYQL